MTADPTLTAREGTTERIAALQMQIAGLRFGWMRMLQHNMGCVRTGVRCERNPCGCHVIMGEWIAEAATDV